MCKYCERMPGLAWKNQVHFINTEEEFKDINSHRIWNTHNRKNQTYAEIYDFAGIVKKDYEGKENANLYIFMPEIEENACISINYCPFCGKRLGDTKLRFI